MKLAKKKKCPILENTYVIIANIELPNLNNFITCDMTGIYM
jgi:hypothetical protein